MPARPLAVWLLGLTLAGLLLACSSGSNSQKPKALLKVGAEPAYLAVMESLAKSYSNRVDDQPIRVNEASDARLIQALLDDSIRVALLGRSPSTEEMAKLKKNDASVRKEHLATDALVVVVNPGNADTLLDLPTLKAILQGKVKTWTQLPRREAKAPALRDSIRIVFDGPGSGSLYYIRDSVLGGALPSATYYTLANPKAMLDYVARTPGAIGFSGLPLVSLPVDSIENPGFIPGIKVVHVAEGPDMPHQWPNLYTLLKRQYPLRRDLYIVAREPWPDAGTALAAYCADRNKGQLIIRKMNMLQALDLSRGVVIRERSDVLPSTKNK